MYLLGLGLVLLLMKFLELGAVAAWDWWLVLSPFGLALVWWAWADWSGYTKRRSVEKVERRKKQRIAKSREAMGIAPKKPRR